jgi:hypothetical protein
MCKKVYFGGGALIALVVVMVASVGAPMFDIKVASDRVETQAGQGTNVEMPSKFECAVAPKLTQPLLEASSLGSKTSPSQWAAASHLVIPSATTEQPQSDGLTLDVKAAPGVELTMSGDAESTQIVGVVSAGLSGEVLRIHHAVNCGGDASSSVELSNDGSAFVTSELSDGETKSWGISRPWAYDESGSPIPIHYALVDGDLIVSIDASNATGSVIFDPTYTGLSCFGHWSTLSAAQYLDLFGALDIGYCPVTGLMVASGGGMPVWAYETNVARHQGKVLVTTVGDACTPPGVETGPAWDFWVPCQAHDYCYDLRKAGFSGTVSDGDCDSVFLSLMAAHCVERAFFLQLLCTETALVYYAAVSHPNVVTYSSPGTVRIRNSATSQCATVNAGSTADFANIHQWTCVGVNNQRYRLVPIGGGGFRIIAVHSGKCAMAVYGLVYQSTCGGYLAGTYQIQGALGNDSYSLRSSADPSQCWRAYGYTVGSDINNSTCDDYNTPWIWYIQPS